MPTVRCISAKILEPGIRKVFADALSFPYKYDLFVEDDSDRSGLRVSCRATINGKLFGAAIRIDRVMVEDDQYQVITENVKALAKMFERTMEKDFIIPKKEIRMVTNSGSWVDWMGNHDPSVVYYDDPWDIDAGDIVIPRSLIQMAIEPTYVGPDGGQP